MSELPRRLSAKTNLSANWLNRLLDWCRARDLKAGPGIRLTRTPSGTTVSLSRSPKEADAGALGPIPAYIGSSGTGRGVYQATFYPKGASGGVTFSGTVYLTALSVHSMGDRIGWVLAHPVATGAEYWAVEEAAEEETT